MSWLTDLEANPAVDDLAQLTAGQGAVAPTVHRQPAEPPPAAVPPSAGGAPVAPAGAGGEPDLVDWNGRKVSRQYVGQFDEIRNNFPGLSLSSAYRSPEQNAAAGGVKRSDHLTGRATDWTGSPQDMYAAVAYANAHGAKQAMVHNAGSGMHAHIAY